MLFQGQRVKIKTGIYKGKEGKVHHYNSPQDMYWVCLETGSAPIYEKFKEDELEVVE